MGGQKFTSSPAPLKCTNKTGEFCRFPFVLNGVKHWDCVNNAEGNPVCNINIPASVTNKQVQKFNNTDSFVPCKTCDECSIQATDYLGFVLKHEREAKYVGVADEKECQILCQLAKNCNFFKFEKQGSFSDQKFCYIKDGLGKQAKNPQHETLFGSKFCPGNTQFHQSGNSQMSVRSQKTKMEFAW